MTATNSTITVSVVRITDYPVPFDGGIAYYSGWAVAKNDGSIFSADGRVPFCWRRKSVAAEVAASGLLPGAQFVPPAA